MPKEFCRVWLNFLDDVNFYVSQPLNGSNFLTICPIWMNNPSMKNYYVIVFKYYVFHNLSCDVFADVSIFLSFYEKYVMWPY